HILVVRATVLSNPSALRAMRGIRASICRMHRVKSFGSKCAWRTRLANDPAVHLAMVEFPDRAPSRGPQRFDRR
ncbi:MAG TPA: hypothetical protein VF499_06125, partial [Afipia sp.]